MPANQRRKALAMLQHAHLSAPCLPLKNGAFYGSVQYRTLLQPPCRKSKRLVSMARNAGWNRQMRGISLQCRRDDTLLCVVNLLDGVSSLLSLLWCPVCSSLESSSMTFYQTTCICCSFLSSKLKHIVSYDQWTEQLTKSHGRQIGHLVPSV